MTQNNKRRSRKGAGRKHKRASLQTREMVAQPRKLPMRFTFNQRLSLTEGAVGTGATYVFRLNSLYDPNSTGVGTQPVGYDQWSTHFDRSIVTACDVKITFHNNTASNAACRFGFFPITGVSSIPTDVDAYASQWGAAHSMMGGASRTLSTLRKKYDVAKVLGISRLRLMDDVQYTESTSGPAVAGVAQALLVLFISGVTAAVTANIDVTLVYHCVFFDPITLSTS